MTGPYRGEGRAVAADQPIPVIDITRAASETLVCPECGTSREMPVRWQDILRRSMTDQDLYTWDGLLRCRNRHPEPVVMVSLGMRVPVRYEPDGSVIVHLATEDREHALCTGEPWYGPGDDIPAGTPMRQCQACHRTTYLLTELYDQAKTAKEARP